MMFVRSMGDRLVAPWQMEELMRRASRCRLKVDYVVEEGRHHPVWYANPGLFSSALNSFMVKAVGA